MKIATIKNRLVVVCAMAMAVALALCLTACGQSSAGASGDGSAGSGSASAAAAAQSSQPQDLVIEESGYYVTEQGYVMYGFRHPRHGVVVRGLRDSVDVAGKVEGKFA